MVGGFIAASVVALVQFARARDRRLLLLAAMFALQSQALGRQWWDVWKDVCQGGVCLAGLGLLFTLSPRPPHERPVSAAPGGASTHEPKAIPDQAKP
jgi:hypothetical protein